MFHDITALDLSGPGDTKIDIATGRKYNVVLSAGPT